jgi:hypothetical protein
MESARPGSCGQRRVHRRGTPNRRAKLYLAWALYALLFTVGGFTLWYRATYNVFPGQSADARVHWCNRNYDNYAPALSLRQVEDGASRPVRVVGNYPPLALDRDQLLAE